MPDHVEIDAGGEILTLAAQGRRHRFHAIWLRDNSLDPETRSPGNGQRLIALSDIPSDLRISAAGIEAQNVSITFSPEGKTVVFPVIWLLENAYDQTDAASQILPAAASPWDATLPVPSFDFRAAADNPLVRRNWLSAIRRFGFARMTGGRTHARAVRCDRPFWFRSRNQLRTALRGSHRGQPDQSGVYQPWATGPHRQPLPRSGSDIAAALLP